ncbi:hypothetical protein QFC20_002002 [Naganishia adeliensis]|uniref:Uncharacterized protein n=1 Tax=Naganishia adeliensis TaxID=92952 RepID=A0ACC2WPM5_9TREE|nr:hypothetical protein QFC20_002002 [Naganishia adeliensis]
MAMFGMISSPYLSDHQVSAVYPTVESLKKVIEEVTERLFGLVVGGGAVLVNGGWDRGVVVRCGALGCCVATQRYMDAASSAESLRPRLTWIDAYWTKDATPDFQDHIVDVTGGGNAFLGGLSAGWKLTDGDPVEASYHATVSASYAIEQDGLPRLASNADGEETWNGDQPLERLRKLKARRRV